MLKINAPSAPKLTSPDGAADPPVVCKATSGVPERCAVGPQRRRRYDIRAIRRARCGSRRFLPFARSTWRSSGLLFPFPPVSLPARRHTDLRVVPDRFLALLQTPAALPSADRVSAANPPVVRGPGPARRAKQDVCPECLLLLPRGARD